MYWARYTDPKSVGTIVRAYVRCGKERCRCRRGELHGPYWYLYYRQYGRGRWRLRKQYVRSRDVAALRQRIRLVKAWDRSLKAFLKGGLSD